MISMKVSPVVWKETKRIAIGVLILTALMVAIFAVCGRFDSTVLWGALLGCAYAIVNFFLMAYTIQRGTETTHTKAKTKIQLSYTLRMLLMLLVGVLGVTLPCFHWLAVLLPFVFPRLSIYLMQLLKIVDLKTEPPQRAEEHAEEKGDEKNI